MLSKAWKLHRWEEMGKQMEIWEFHSFKGANAGVLVGIKSVKVFLLAVQMRFTKANYVYAQDGISLC